MIWSTPNQTSRRKSLLRKRRFRPVVSHPLACLRSSASSQGWNCGQASSDDSAVFRQMAMEFQSACTGFGGMIGKFFNLGSFPLHPGESHVVLYARYEEEDGHDGRDEEPRKPAIEQRNFDYKAMRFSIRARHHCKACSAQLLTT